MKIDRLEADAIVDTHLDGGFTKLWLERARSHVDVPTEKIPRHLRRIGSRFVVVLPCIRPEEDDSVVEIRGAVKEIEIKEV
jgi:hypothetical protein